MVGTINPYKKMRLDAALVTGKELFKLGDIGRAELIKGVLVRKRPRRIYMALLKLVLLLL